MSRSYRSRRPSGRSATDRPDFDPEGGAGYFVACTRQAALVALSMASPLFLAAGAAGGCSKRGLPRSALTAQVTFCGKIPGSLRRRMTAALELTTPTTEPSAVITGAPDSPGCTGTVIWRKAVSASGPDTALTAPPENLAAASRVPAAGNPTVKIGSPGRSDRVSRRLR